jgi:hypothetical protein
MSLGRGINWPNGLQHTSRRGASDAKQELALDVVAVDPAGGF